MKKSIIISILMLAVLTTNGQTMVKDTLTRQTVNDLLRSLKKSGDTTRIDIYLQLADDILHAVMLSMYDPGVKNRDTLAPSFASNN